VIIQLYDDAHELIMYHHIMACTVNHKVEASISTSNTTHWKAIHVRPLLLSTGSQLLHSNQVCGLYSGAQSITPWLPVCLAIEKIIAEIAVSNKSS